jgi:hypothetical protein
LNQWLYWNNEIYHSPADDLNQKINYAAVEQHLRFLYNFIVELADFDKEIEWEKGILYENNRLRLKAEKR